jgi:riboflavin kinase/FMN adenylyltransferase
MQRLARLEDLPRGRPAYLAIGSFDGVHRGHQAVLRTLVSAARRDGASAAALTFSPHPASVLHPERAPAQLTTGEDRAARIAALGVEFLVELRFDRDLAAVPAEGFAHRFLREMGGVARAFVGPDFRFGRGAAGTAATLEAAGIAVTTVGPVVVGGQPVSSTRIRAALADGRPALAARLLGRPYDVPGVVVAGEGRGRRLGFPTANVAVPEELVKPAAGVYAVWGGREDGPAPGPPPRGLPAADRPGVANLGLRPTFRGRGLRLEVHLFDFDGDLYGTRVRVAFLRRLRGERRFPTAEALAERIRRDAARARRLLEAAAEPAPRRVT